MRNFLRGTILLLSLTALLVSCKRQDDGDTRQIPEYSGFMVDDTVYAVDSLVIDTTGTGCSARLYSASAGGGMIEIHARHDSWSSKDSNYYYLPSPPRSVYSGPDSMGVVSICFTPRGDSSSLFCLKPPPTFNAPFGIEVRNGKMKFYQYYRDANSQPDHTLAINYQEP